MIHNFFRGKKFKKCILGEHHLTPNKRTWLGPTTKSGVKVSKLLPDHMKEQYVYLNNLYCYRICELFTEDQKYS